MEPVITPLSQQLTSFPHFMPNQVLTHTQLNELAVYLEQQDRFTRQRLIGIGIVCGLQAKLAFPGGTRTVQISRGVGVTSCGFMIDIPQQLSFTKKKSYTTPSDYAPFVLGASNTPINCIELKDQNSTESGISNLTAGDVSDKIVVLFLDLEDKPNGKCIGENCDEKGNKWVFTLRVLLIDRAGANVNSLHNINRVLLESYAPNAVNNPLTNDAQREDFFNPPFELPHVFAERFGNVNGVNPNVDFNLSTLTDFPGFEDTYRIIILDSATRVAKALHKSYLLFKPVFDTQLVINSNPFNGYQNNKISNTLSNKLKDLLDNSKPGYRKGNCQYVYDFVRDLIDTYNELRSELFALSSRCSPDSSKFPRHLLLGELKTDVDFGKFNPADYEPPSVYRNHFISSPINDGQSAHFSKIKMLMKRIRLMIDNLSFSGLLQASLSEEKIMITPDKTCCEPLGNQRIPFYYNREGAVQLSKYWNFDFTVQNRSFENRSYWANLYVPSSLSADLKARLINPLLYDICSLNKLSIEGHVGKELQTALDQLKLFRKRHNLSFDILAVKLDTKINEIVLADDNLIADIQAMYLAERNEIACCLEDLKNYIIKNKNLIGFFLLLTLYVMVDDPQIRDALIAYLQPIVSQLLDAYVDAIEEMSDSLTTNIKTFDIQKFLNVFPVFTSFTSLFKYGINTWGDVEFFVMNNKDGANSINKFKWMLSDLISIMLNLWELYLDKVTDDCIAGKFYSIYRIFYERVQTFSLFHKLNEKVHGMEHIAGTSKGGTFILVYEDEAEQQEFIGKLVDEKGVAVANAMIKDDETGIVYGITDTKGEYRIKAAKGLKKVNFSKPGFVNMRGTVGGGKSARQKMYSYSAAASGKAEKVKMSRADNLFIRMKASLDSLKEMDPKLTEFMKAVKLDAAWGHVPGISFGAKNTYKVVADFYLPHLIHNYKTEIETFDACEEIGEVKMIDFGLITKVLGKKTKSQASKMMKEMFTARGEK